jgi:hypothetical protein
MLTFGPLALAAGALVVLLQLETPKVANSANTVRVKVARKGVQNFSVRTLGCLEEFIKLIIPLSQKL